MPSHHPARPFRLRLHPRLRLRLSQYLRQLPWLLCQRSSVGHQGLRQRPLCYAVNRVAPAVDRVAPWCAPFDSSAAHHCALNSPRLRYPGLPGRTGGTLVGGRRRLPAELSGQPRHLLQQPHLPVRRGPPAQVCMGMMCPSRQPSNTSRRAAPYGSLSPTPTTVVHPTRGWAQRPATCRPDVRLAFIN